LNIPKINLKKIFNFDKNKKKKKNKSGSIAIPFMVTFIISLLSIGGFAVYMLDYVRNNTLDTGGETKSSIEYVPTAEDNMTMLLVVDPRNPATEPYTFVLLRFLPADKKIFVMPIPEKTLANVSNKRDTLDSFYLYLGIVKTVQAVEDVTKVKIDRYLHCGADTFKQITEVLGSVNFLVPKEFESTIGTGEFLFSGEDINDIIFFGFYGKGEDERIVKIGTILTRLINQSSKAKVSESLEDKYSALKSAIDTDIDSAYFYGQILAAKYLLENAAKPAEFIKPEGTFAMEDQFIFDPAFTANLKNKLKIG
jgi:anionic cell wall polymer biosynthesis LytR-Cps2A-Psr (LCP) family protein